MATVPHQKSQLWWRRDEAVVVARSLGTNQIWWDYLIIFHEAEIPERKGNSPLSLLNIWDDITTLLPKKIVNGCWKDCRSPKNGLPKDKGWGKPHHDRYGWKGELEVNTSISTDFNYLDDRIWTFISLNFRDSSKPNQSFKLAIASPVSFTSTEVGKVAMKFT